MNYEEMLQEFLEDELFGKSQGTKDTYLTSIKKFITWLEDSGLTLQAAKESQDGITKLDVQEYINYVYNRQKLSPSTIKKDWAGISSLLSWKGILAKETLKKIQIPKVQESQEAKALDDKLINKILREEYKKAEYTGNWRDYLIFIVLAYFGLRVEEVVRLDLDSVQISERKGELQVKGKGNKLRTIPFPKQEENPKVREAFTLYMTQRLKMNTEFDALFISRLGRRLSKRSAQEVVEKYGVTCHQFRHSFVTKLVEKDMPIPWIMALTGHASADMVARYSKPNKEKKEQAMSAVEYSLYKE